MARTFSYPSCTGTTPKENSRRFPSRSRRRLGTCMRLPAFAPSAPRSRTTRRRSCATSSSRWSTASTASARTRKRTTPSSRASTPLPISAGRTATPTLGKASFANTAACFPSQGAPRFSAMLGIFSKWLDRPASFARHLDAGTEAYRQGNANVSIQHFRKCLEISPDRWEIVHRLAAVQADIVGDIDESVRLLRCARRLRNRLHNPPEGPPPYCFLQSPWGGDIAGIAAMEHVIKREILQGRDPKNIILYAPQHKQAPRNALLDKMAAHVSIVTDENELPLPLHAMLSVLEDDVLCESLDGLHKQAWHAAADIAHAWENSRRGPLLNFSEDERTTGAAHLRKLGVPDDAWFVCVRENTADLGTYAPALDAVTRRGGWVVCLNRSNDAPRAAIPRVVHCAAQSHSLGEPEVFLLGACRFFIGGASDH